MVIVGRFDPSDLRKYDSYDGRYISWEAVQVDTPQCIASFAEKRRSDGTSTPWHLWNDEIWFILEGEMELAWQTPPMFNGTKRADLRPGDLVYLPTGVSVLPQIVSESVRLLWVAMPRPQHFGADDFWGGQPGVAASDEQP
jgi:mannose-6-phosphate isomerase-like protein (cupin superfamily)